MRVASCGSQITKITSYKSQITNMPSKKKSDWQILDTQISYDNPWIQVQHNEVLNPAGNEGIYGVVHFKNYAIGILPLDKDLNTYLVGQYRFPLKEYSWEIPEGGCPEGTDLLATAKRELKEEVGLSADKWTYLLKMHVSNCVTNEVGHVYIAQDLTEGIAEPEETENLTIKKVPFETAYNMVMEGKITDSLSMVAIMKAKILIDSGAL